MKQHEQNRIAKIRTVALGATDIAWSTAKAERIAAAAAQAAYGAMMRVIERGYTGNGRPLKRRRK